MADTNEPLNDAASWAPNIGDRAALAAVGQPAATTAARSPVAGVGQ